MPTFQYKKTLGQGDFVDRTQNTPTTPKKDKYDIGETEDVTGVSMMSPAMKKVVDTYHATKGTFGSIINKVLGGRFG